MQAFARSQCGHNDLCAPSFSGNYPPPDTTTTSRMICSGKTLPSKLDLRIYPPVILCSCSASPETTTNKTSNAIVKDLARPVQASGKAGMSSGVSPCRDVAPWYDRGYVSTNGSLTTHSNSFTRRIRTEQPYSPTNTVQSGPSFALPPHWAELIGFRESGTLGDMAGPV